MFGATVRGPRNKRAATENQDSWIRARGAYGHVIVVCDGLGSRAASALGAQMACAAVRRAVGLWPGIDSGADPLLLIRLVELLWRLSVSPRPLSECATTCMFALRENGGRFVLAGLGDGLAAMRTEGTSVTTFGGRRDSDFTDETVALGVPHQLEDWWVATPAPASRNAVVLATDGVADDLHPPQIGGFVEWIVTEVGGLPSAARCRVLRRELTNWPVPHHTDDKTVAALIDTAGGAS